MLGCLQRQTGYSCRILSGVTGTWQEWRAATESFLQYGVPGFARHDWTFPGRRWFPITGSREALESKATFCVHEGGANVSVSDDSHPWQDNLLMVTGMSGTRSNSFQCNKIDIISASSACLRTLHMHFSVFSDPPAQPQAMAYGDSRTKLVALPRLGIQRQPLQFRQGRKFRVGKRCKVRAPQRPN